jgi:hypothetical protein
MACWQGLPDPGLVKRVASCLRPACLRHGGELDGPGRSCQSETATDSPSLATTTAWVALVPGELAEELALGGHRPEAEGRAARRHYKLTSDCSELARAALAPGLQRHRSAGLAATPWARSHDRPGVPGDQPGRPAHLVGELGGPLGLAAAAL